jgi:PAS domain S-box-containing protein
MTEVAGTSIEIGADAEMTRLLPVIFDSIADGVTVLDRRGTLRYANASAARMMGYDSASELVGRSSASVVGRFALLDDDGRTLDASALPTRRAFAGDTDPEATVRFRTEGSEGDRWSLVRARLLPGLHPDEDLVITSFQDITAIKQGERRLSFLLQASAFLGESADLHATLDRVAWLVVPSVADWCAIDVIGDGGTVERVAMAHADPDLLRTAREIERRWPPDPMQPTAVREVTRRRHSVHVREVTDEVLKTGARDGEHLEALRGLRLREVLSAPLIGRGHVLGVITVGHSTPRPPLSPEDVAMVEDLGRRAGAAVDTAELLGASQEALRLQEEFMAVTSHDMRTPLAAVRGFAQLARRHLSGEQQDLASVDRWLGDIEESATRLTGLVSEFMDVTLLRAGQDVPLQLQPTDLVAVAGERLREHESAAAETHRFSLSTEAEEIVGNWDPARISRVLDNLLSNAVKFSPDGGTIEVHLETDGTYATAAISDQGIGIAPAEMSRIFLPMYRGSNASGVAGTGLGLAGSRRLVELMGGAITVKSGIGKGSIFRVQLPIAGPDPNADRSAS